MEPTRVALVGHIGALARAAAESLRQRGHNVYLLVYPAPPEKLSSQGPARILYFPFPCSNTRSQANRLAQDLSSFESLLAWAANSGVVRLVLRSHAIAYGSNVKNPGLLDEERGTLLPKTSVDRRWLQAEDLLWKAARSCGTFSAAAVRLTTVLEPREGDFVTRLLTRTVVWPLAGYDPMVQFLSVSDAAEALALALLSDAAGLFNVAGAGAVPFRKALRAAAPVRIPVGSVLQRAVRSVLWRAGLAEFPGESIEQVRYNWTVSAERAARELGFVARFGSAQALKEFLKSRKQGDPARIKDSYDEYGLDPDYLASREPWFVFLRRIYWRVEVEGIENVPSAGGALLVSNHRGFMPFDGVVHRSLILEARKRHVRFLVIPSLFKFPFLSDFLIKQGGVVASQENTKRLLGRNELVGIFPEGINGAFRMYRGAYKLGEMGKDVFAKMAIANTVPVIPAVTIGHVEIFPILAKVRSSAVTRLTGWPFLPITPTFPLLPIPLPTKWHIRYLEPISVGNLRPEDAENRKLVKQFSQYVGEVIQRNIDEMLARRRHIFFGNIFGPTANTRGAQSVPAGE